LTAAAIPPSQALAELRALVAGIGVELEQKGIHAEHACAMSEHAAIAVLKVGGVDDGLHQQALRVDENVPLLAS
jgi:hypothetical protein